MNKLAFALFALALALLVLPSCGGGIVYSSRVPRPAPYVQMVDVAPGPGYMWAGGYWQWTGNRYDWVPDQLARGRPGIAADASRVMPRG
ncbi:MAG: YXWGXW repeat-containing protein [Sandaracinaceae bacterium]|nr:YXWGXW repeat-containing protein [Sandaracinaceae bacterium]